MISLQVVFGEAELTTSPTFWLFALKVHLAKDRVPAEVATEQAAVHGKGGIAEFQRPGSVGLLRHELAVPDGNPGRPFYRNEAAGTAEDPLDAGFAPMIGEMAKRPDKAKINLWWITIAHPVASKSDLMESS